MRKRKFTYLEVLAEQVRKVELPIFARQGRAEVRKQNFTYLAVKAERKCESGTSHIWQSMQNESADAELWIFGSKDRAEAEVRKRTRNFLIFGSQGRAEVCKRNFRSLAVKTEQKCGSSIAVLWQSSQVGRAEADLNIFDRPISYWQSQYALARALGNTGLNPFLGPSCRVKKSPSSRRIGPLGSVVPAVFGHDVCLMSGSLSHSWFDHA